MSTTARATGKLGKLPVRTDVRTLRLRRYVDPTRLPPPPETLDLTERVTEWPMYANDRVGDCMPIAARDRYFFGHACTTIAPTACPMRSWTSAAIRWRSSVTASRSAVARSPSS